MQHLSLVVAQKDSDSAQQLSLALKRYFRKVIVAHSHVEIHDALAFFHCDAVIVDLELLNRDELRRLCQNSLGAAVVATHRSPDDEMWMACLELGAADCCQNRDVEGMLRALQHSVHMTHSRAA